MGGKMKFGEMKYDVPFEKIKNHHWDFNPLQEFMIELEGKRLYKSHPEYSYLQEDPWLKTDRDFYESIVFAYMMDFIKQNDPQYLEYYIKVYGEKDPNDKRYKATNQTYLNRYGLTIRDVDFVNKEFTIDKQLIKEKNGVYYIADPKSKAGFRTIPLSDEAYKAIRTLIARR